MAESARFEVYGRSKLRYKIITGAYPVSCYTQSSSCFLGTDFDAVALCSVAIPTLIKDTAFLGVTIRYSEIKRRSYPAQCRYGFDPGAYLLSALALVRS
jgi:hypothetical protein